jgi:colicin import membrane protein
MKKIKEIKNVFDIKKKLSMSLFGYQLFGKSAQEKAKERKEIADEQIRNFKISDLTQKGKKLRSQYMDNPDAANAENVLYQLDIIKRWKDYMTMYKGDRFLDAGNRLNGITEYEERAKEMETGPTLKAESERLEREQAMENAKLAQERLQEEQRQQLEREAKLQQEEEERKEARYNAVQKQRKILEQQEEKKRLQEVQNKLRAQEDLAHQRKVYLEEMIAMGKKYQEVVKEYPDEASNIEKYIAKYYEFEHDKNDSFPDISNEVRVDMQLPATPLALKYAMKEWQPEFSARQKYKEQMNRIGEEYRRFLEDNPDQSNRLLEYILAYEGSEEKKQDPFPDISKEVGINLQIPGGPLAARFALEQWQKNEGAQRMIEQRRTQQEQQQRQKELEAKQAEQRARIQQQMRPVQPAMPQNIPLPQPRQERKTIPGKERRTILTKPEKETEELTRPIEELSRPELLELQAKQRKMFQERLSNPGRKFWEQKSRSEAESRPEDKYDTESESESESETPSGTEFTPMGGGIIRVAGVAVGGVGAGNNVPPGPPNPGNPIPIVPPVENEGVILQCLNGERKLIYVQKRDTPRYLLLQSVQNGDVMGLNLPDGKHVFESDKKGNFLKDYVTRNFPPTGRMFEIQGNIRTNQFNLGEIDNPVIRDSQQYKYVEGPIVRTTFWDIIPNREDEGDHPRRDIFYRMKEQLKHVYTGRVCADDQTRNYISWFLLQWLLIRTSRAAWEAPQTLNLDVAVIQHGYRVLSDIFNIGNRLPVNMFFHPFIRGFIDKPETWISEKIKDSGELYLKLPNDNDDVLATTLRSHPNTYLVRLSPTQPMTLEFIRYTVRDIESSGKGRKLEDFVVFYRLNMIHNEYDMCDGAMISLYRATQNIYHQDPTGATTKVPNIDLGILLMLWMKVKAQKTYDDIYFAPIMTSLGSQIYNLQSLCNTKYPGQFELYTPHDYTLDISPESRAVLKWLLKIYTNYLKLPVDEMLENYAYYLDSEKFCKSLFPSMDNFGDPGCSISKKWMIENVPTDIVNPLMQNCYNHVEERFYSGSLWECKLSIRREITLRKRTKDIDKQDPLYPIRQQHIWHIVRWLGLNYFKEVDLARTEGRVVNTWVRTIQIVLSWLLRSGSVYPFATSEMADNMIIALGSLGVTHGIVLRLSTSQVLGLDIRTHRPNAEYKEDIPYAQQFKTETIQANEWGSWFRSPPLDFRELEYLMRIELYKKKNQGVLVRNLNNIRIFLESCNVTVPLSGLFKRARKWATNREDDVVKYIFLRETIEEDLADLDPVVAEKYRRFSNEWQKIRSLTVRVNAEGEKASLSTIKQACVSGTNPRIDFSWLGNINVPICEDSDNWIFEQPLMSTTFLDNLIKKYKKSDKPTVFLENMKLLWQTMSNSKIWSAHWCNVGKRGNRNKTMMINWFGMDTINYICDNCITEEYQFKSRDAALPFKTPKDRVGFITYQVLDLLSDPSFDLFLTPPEQKLLAYKYPGFLIVTLSGTKPGTFNISGVSLDNITELIEDELDMENLLEYIPPAESDKYALPIGLLIRLYLYDNYGMHIATLKDPKDEDQISCNSKKGLMDTDPVKNLQAILLSYVGEIRFTKPVNAEYASRITALVLAGSTDGKAENYVAGKGWFFSQTQYDRWFTSDEKRAIEIHPGWNKFWEAKGVIRGSFKDFIGGIRNIPNRLRNWANDQFTFYRNPTHWWYNTNTLEPDVFNMILQKLMRGSGDKIEGYVGGELADLPNLKPTKIQSLLDKIQPPGFFESSLINKSLKFRKKEFGGDAFETLGEEGYIAKIKKKLGFSVPPSTPPVGEDDLDIINVGETTGANKALVTGLLMQKKNAGRPFGPKETVLAENLGILPKPPAAKAMPVSMAAATGVAPPPGQRWTLPAGPMSDSAGPPFQQIVGEAWKDYNSPNDSNYFQALNEGFEETDEQGTNACSENGPDYIFPAFDVDSNGKVVARCGRSNWMMDNTQYSKAQFERLDPENQKLLMAIANMAQHWCPTVSHQIKLWRWLGAGCLGKVGLEYLAEEALQALESSSATIQNNPITTLRAESMKDQLQMLQDFRLRITGMTANQKPQTKCKKRIIFLTQMISSNILFPYIKDRKNALILAGYNPDKVVVMLGWSKSGSVHCIRSSSTMPGRPLEREYQAEDLVNYMQYVPTIVRLKIFHDFSGGIAASNYQFYIKVLRDAKKDSCIQSLSSMKRYAVRASLPRGYQERLDRIYEQAKMAGGQVTDVQRAQLNEIQNISILLQGKNLTAQELYLFEEIMKLENVPPEKMKDADVAETASRLYKARDVDLRITEAETFENLALCQRPEFVPYIRKKIKDKYPELKISDIEAMDRETLCKTLLNNPNIEKINLPVYLWQIDNAPSELLNNVTHLLALWDENKRDNINAWLLKNYGVTVYQMREYNKDYQQEQQLVEQGRRKMAENDVKTRQENELQDMTIRFRQFLIDGGRCVWTTQGNDVCQKMNFTDLSGEAVQLCNEQCETNKNIPAVKIMSLMYKNICNPKVPLLMNDVEFLLESFKALSNYYELMKIPQLKQDKRRDKQGEQIQTMFLRFLGDIGAKGQGVAWRDVPLKDILDQTPIKNIVNKYFNGDITKRSAVPLRSLWIQFAREKPDVNTGLSFTFTVLLYISLINGVLVLPTDT